MATTLKLVLLPILLSLIAFTASARKQDLTEQRVSEGQQCRFQKLQSVQPSERIESEGGFSEFWNENDEQFQCAGVSALRFSIEPPSMYVPSYLPTPRLLYIERGYGMLGLHFPGCAETFHAEEDTSSRSRNPWFGGKGSRGREQEGQQGREQISMKDQHQKVLRVKQGDIIALHPGITHWWFNDGREKFVAVAIDDLNHVANQLDQSFRQFHLAGGVSRKGIRSHGEPGGEAKFNFQNILNGFDTNLLAQALDVSPNLLKRMQQDQSDRGFIVNAQEMSLIQPDEERQEQSKHETRQPWTQRRDNSNINSIEETMCSVQVRYNLDKEGEAEVYSREAGRINIVNDNKLPILQLLDMSAERGNLYSNALFTPHWSSNEHTILYITEGDAKIQVVDQKGQTMFDDNVNEGDMFVIPQFYVSIGKAGKNGLKYTAFKTSSQQFKHPLGGYTSVLNGMPIQVLANIFQISINDARSLKQSKHGETLLMSPSSKSF